MKNALTAILAALLAFGALAPAQDAPAILPAKTEAQADLEALDEGILRVAEALNHAAAVLTSEHSKVWGMPDERLLALLNASVPRTIAIAQAKDKAAAEINALLDALKLAKYSNRAPIGFGRSDVLLNPDTGRFEIVPPADPEPTPQP